MVRNKQRSCVVRLDDLTHLRLKAAAEAEGRDMSVIVERVLLAYYRAEHPSIISSITHVPEPIAPDVAQAPADAPKKAKTPRKPRSPKAH
jgi:hypothetical protein